MRWWLVTLSSIKVFDNVEVGEKRPDQVQLVASGLSMEPGRMVTDLDAPVLEEPGTPTITASHVKLSDCGRK